jgi:hypothetical protein
MLMTTELVRLLSNLMAGSTSVGWSALVLMLVLRRLRAGLPGCFHPVRSVSPFYFSATKMFENMVQFHAMNLIVFPCLIIQFGYIVLTTSAGIMDHEEARRKNVGGKVLGFFYWMEVFWKEFELM